MKAPKDWVGVASLWRIVLGVVLRGPCCLGANRRWRVFVPGLWRLDPQDQGSRLTFSGRTGKALALALLLSGSSLLSSQAWASYGVDETAIEWVNRASKLAPTTVDTAFGDHLSVYDGSVEFNTVDVSVPGIGPAVEIRRSFPVRDTNIQQGTGIAQGSGERREVGEWTLDLPQLSGVFESITGWQVAGDAPYARCSSESRPKDLSMFPADVYWSGNELHVPGQVSEGLLENHATVRPFPGDGKRYPWTTKSGWMISCTATTANGYPGEGFVATGPDGTRYYLDWVVKRNYPELTGPQYLNAFSGGYNISKIGRQKIYFLATRVIDRFGNQVNYNYTGDLLTSITASDGRSVTLAYANNSLSVVMAGSQTFKYAYSGEYLQTVTLPDASKWTYARTGLLSIEHETGMELQNQTTCTVQASQGDDFIYDVTDPAGLKGSFKFHVTGHNKRNVPEYCKTWQYGKVGKITTVKYWQIPLRSVGYSLVQKDISGSGVAPATWTYDYNPVFLGLGNVGFHDDCVADPSACPLSKTVLVNGPSQFERYTYGIWWGVNDGQLLKKEVGSSADDILYTEDYSYVAQAEAAQQPFGNQAGSEIHDYLDPLPSYNRPLRSVVKTLQGATFKSENLAYDVFARPTSINRVSSIYPAGRRESLSYWDNLAEWVIGQPWKNTCTAPTACNGLALSQVDYDANALPIRKYEFGKLRQSLTYYANGMVNTIKDGAGNTTTLANWKRGIPQTVTFPATPDQPTPVSTSAVADNNGWVTSITDENGYKTCYTYDPMGRLATIKYTSETVTGTCDTGSWNMTSQTFAPFTTGAEYGIPAGHWKQTISTGNARRITYFDAMWRPLVEESYDTANVAGTRSVSVKRYDISGRLAFQSYALGALSNYAAITQGIRTTYDALDRVIRVEQDSEIGVLASTTVYQTDFKTQFTNPRGYATTTSYMAYDQPTTDWPVKVEMPESAVTAIARDPFGKPTSLTRGDVAGTLAVTRNYVYDDLQQLCKTIEPETSATLMDYDAAGNLAWSASGQALPALTCDRVKVPTASRTARTYDPRNRLLTLRFPDGLGDQDWSYTADGKTDQIVTYNGANHTAAVTNAYHYNKRGMLDGQGESVHQQAWYTYGIGYGYDGNGSLAVQIYPSGQSVSYLPNALGQATQAGSYATGVSYYPNGAIKQFTYGNGIVHSLTQNMRQLPDTSRDAFGSTEVLDDGYDYDPNGNVAGISDGVSSSGARGDRTMGYDQLDRLISTSSPMYALAGSGTARFAYDVLDNLTEIHMPATMALAARDHYYCYDAQWHLTNIKTGGCTGTGTSSVIGLGYDPQGNLSNKNGVTYDFDFGNRLRTATPAGTGTQSYRYDGHGLRVLINSATTGNLIYQYSASGQLMLQRDVRNGTNTLTEYISMGGSLVAESQQNLAVAGTPTVIRYQHTDALGSPVAVTDVNRKVIERSEYEPFGKLLNRPLTDGPDYTGHVSDVVTGLSYMQQRYYDPMIGRFLSVDPVTADSKTGNFNRYWYANNNPYRFTDPDGRETDPVAGGADIRDDELRTNAGNPNVGRFGNTRSKGNWNGGYHNGIDRKAPNGTSLQAPISGVVRIAREKDNPKGGNVIWITKHEDGRSVVIGMAHLSAISVQQGQTVSEGQACIATAGSTGNATGMPKNEEHVHMTVRVDGKLVDPQRWFNDHLPSERAIQPKAN